MVLYAIKAIKGVYNNLLHKKSKKTFSHNKEGQGKIHQVLAWRKGYGGLLN
jgi:hypothetical protein